MINASQLPALRERLKKLIQEELCLARFTEDADGFVFHYERMRLRMMLDTGEPSYVWVGRYFFWAEKAAPDELAVVDRCISEVNHRIKVVKLGREPKPDEQGDYCVTASASFLAEDTGTITAAGLERYFDLIKAGCRLFWDLHRAANKDEAKAAARVETAPAPALRH